MISLFVFFILVLALIVFFRISQFLANAEEVFSYIPIQRIRIVCQRSQWFNNFSTCDRSWTTNCSVYFGSIRLVCQRDQDFARLVVLLYSDILCKFAHEHVQANAHHSKWLSPRFTLRFAFYQSTTTQSLFVTLFS